MSVLGRCLSYREFNKESKERRGLHVPLGVHLTEVSVKRESTVLQVRKAFTV